MCLLFHNFLSELDQDDISTAFVNFFLVTDFDEMFEMEGDNFREFLAKLASKSINENWKFNSWIKMAYPQKWNEFFL